jgi:hypothetical protein
LLEHAHAVSGFAGNLLEGHHSFLAFVYVFVEQLQALFAEGLWSDSNLALLEFCLKTMTNEAYRVNDDVTNQPDWSHRDKDHSHDKLVGFRNAVRLGVHEYHHELVEK